jgi:hypothetical protein
LTELGVAVRFGALHLAPSSSAADGERPTPLRLSIGVLMVYAGRLMTRFREEGPWIHRWLPMTSSAVMTVLGLGIAIQAVAPWMAR